MRVKHAVAHPHVKSFGLEPCLAREIKALECRLGSGTTDQHYLAVTSESAGGSVKFAGLRQGAKTIWRDAYRVQGNSNE